MGTKGSVSWDKSVPTLVVCTLEFDEVSGTKRLNIVHTTNKTNALHETPPLAVF